MTTRPSHVLDELDGERPGQPFTVLAGGRIIEFAPAAGPPWTDLLEALAWPPAFMKQFGPTRRSDITAVEHLHIGQMRALMARWRIHHGLSTDDRDHLRLASMLSKQEYRAAAEQDLWEIHQLDLTGEWQSRRWRRLLSLLDGLRRTSHVSEAFAMDEELAEMYLEQERLSKGATAARSARRYSEFTAEVELLSNAVDRLGELIVAVAASRGARRRKVEPMPRPETAMHRVRMKRTRNHHQYTVARVFGYVDEHGQPTGKRPGPPGETGPHK
jgi:hypothetical protein